MSPQLSPDGTRLVFERGSAEGRDIWILELSENSQLTRLTFGGDNRNPVWMPDGESIVFTLLAAGVTHLQRIEADGSGLEPERLHSVSRTEGVPGHPTISPASDEVLYHLDGDVYSLPLQQNAKSRLILSTRFEETAPRISPGGRWLAYSSDRSGVIEVWIRPYPDVDARAPSRISDGGGTGAVWSRDGRSLFYITDDTIFEVPVMDGKRSGPPVARHSSQLVRRRSFDVGPDDTLYVAQSSSGYGSDTPIVVVENWFQELERLAPTDK